MTTELLNTKQAAEFLQLSTGRVRQLAKKGRIHARHIGRDWVFERAHLQDFKNMEQPKTGRPPKTNLLNNALQDVDLWRSRARSQRAVIEMLKKWIPPNIGLIRQDGWYIGIVEDEEPTP